MSDLTQHRYKPVEAGHKPGAEALVWLKARLASLMQWLKSGVRAVLLGAHWEPGAWRALSAEYGPDEPITGAFDSDGMPAQMHYYPYGGAGLHRPPHR